MTTCPYELVVQFDEETRRTVRYLPTDDPRRVRQFELDEERYEQNPEACLEWFEKY